MDETLKGLVLQAPMVVVLCYAIKALYMDMKSERVQAIAERQVMLAKLDLMASSISTQTVALARVELSCSDKKP